MFKIEEMKGWLPAGTMIVKIDIAKDRAGWLALRKPNINGSQVASVCGVPDAYQTPLQVWGEITGNIPTRDATARMDDGLDAERWVIARVQRTLPEWQIADADFYLWNPDLRIGATIDFLAVHPERPGFGVFEAKMVHSSIVTSKWRGGDRDGPLVVPLAFQLQVITQAKLSGASWAVVALLEDSGWVKTLHIVEVDIHEGAWERIKEDVAFFWREVSEGRTPDAIPARDGAALAKIFPSSRDDEVLDLSSNNLFANDLAERDMLVTRADEIKDRIEEIDTGIKAAMKDHATAVFADGRKITWKTQSRKEYVVKASSFRVFRVGKPAS